MMNGRKIDKYRVTMVMGEAYPYIEQYRKINAEMREGKSLKDDFYNNILSKMKVQYGDCRMNSI